MTCKSALHLGLLVLGLFATCEGLRAAEKRVIGIDGVLQASLAYLEVQDTVNGITYTGSGFILWDYPTRGQVINLLTAEHVLNKGHYLKVFLTSDSGQLEDILIDRIPLQKGKGSPEYWFFESDSGVVSDIVIFRVDSSKVKSANTKAISASQVVDIGEVKLGDRLLCIGFPDRAVFPFVERGKPLATAGTVGYINPTSYLIDQETHHGMSGCIVFREVQTINGIGYRLAGIVSAGYSRHDKYSWISKIDTVDSLFIKYTGKPWDTSRTE